ncbi:MAG: hypothetical protein JXA11_08715 [Phycisphaerae bacterium]|nr:hypothetical protein [Phycisphaerae bacterium]
MLICFGLSWPISILKSLRTKHVRGKSLGFMWLIFLGYVSGFSAKLFRAAATGGWPEWNTPLYVLNGVFVAFDIYLYHRYKNNPEPAALQE